LSPDEGQNFYFKNEVNFETENIFGHFLILKPFSLLAALQPAMRRLPQECDSEYRFRLEVELTQPE